MVIVCPYCEHGLNVKSVRSGRFTPRCAKCGKTFQLTVTLDPEPRFSTARIPAPGKEEGKPPAFDPSATAPPLKQGALPASPALTGLQEVTTAGEAKTGDNADFSVAASLVVRPPDPSADYPDQTAALPDTSAPSLRQQAGAKLDATEADVSDSGAPSAGQEGEVPLQLGNYQIVKVLGRGGMGAVYLARQVSLDRSVALKVMNTDWASNPTFLVRFTREAYAAAQLVHHNVIQVYDIGADHGVNYFSMEFVEGQSLGDLIKKKGKIAPERAVGYILQAARGLRFAHEHGMVHRDVKPDNLMLNRQGIVKVADLGLVRTPGAVEDAPAAELAVPPPAGAKPDRLSLASLSNITQVNQAMGTPSYMAPEQARDSTKVDHRADIYSLGCTLYVMVTGRPVFQGGSALEVMTKHATEPIVRPEVIVKDVPRALGDIVVKMMAKKPEERYASMNEVIRALEDFLGLHTSGKIDKNEEHLRTLEQGVKGFNSAGAVQLRGWLLLGFFASCIVLFLLLLPLGFGKTAAGILGLALMTALSYFVVHGSASHGYLFLKARELILSSSWSELLKIGVGVLLIVSILVLLAPGKLWLGWMLAGIVAVGLALGLHFTVDRKIAAQRAKHVEKVEHMLKTLRMHGLSEEALQEFVRKYGGDRWEEFFEALFGYEAKLAARATHAAAGKARPRYAGWRDPIVRWIDRYQRVRQEARERKHLQLIERESLVAQGVNAAQAQQQAERVADAMVQKAAEIKEEAAATVPPALDMTVPPEQATLDRTAAKSAKSPPKRINVQEMYDVAVGSETTPVRRKSILADLGAALFGGGVRFILGSALVLFCLLWMHARNLLPGSTTFDDAAEYESIWKRAQTAEPLDVPLVPEVVRKAFGNFNPGVAGILLVLSAIWRSWKIGLLQIVAAAIMVIGPMAGAPEVAGLSPAVLCLAVGVGVSVLGFVVGRDT